MRRSWAFHSVNLKQREYSKEISIKRGSKAGIQHNTSMQREWREVDTVRTAERSTKEETLLTRLRVGQTRPDETLHLIKNKSIRIM